MSQSNEYLLDEYGWQERAYQNAIQSGDPPAQVAKRKAECDLARATVLARMTPEWQPIATAPKDGTRILGYDPESHPDDMPMVMWWEPRRSSPDGEWMDAWGMESPNPTQWMPLPAPPTEPSS